MTPTDDGVTAEQLLADFVKAFDAGAVRMESEEISEPYSISMSWPWHEEWLANVRARLSAFGNTNAAIEDYNKANARCEELTAALEKIEKRATVPNHHNQSLVASIDRLHDVAHEARTALTGRGE
jgi:hypothetical protein